MQLIGEIDVANADAHGGLLCAMLDLGCGAQLLVDCRELAFLELRGMAMMQRVHRYGVERGVEVSWTGLSEQQLHVLALAGLDRQLVIAEGPGPV